MEQQIIDDAIALYELERTLILRQEDITMPEWINLDPQIQIKIVYFYNLYAKIHQDEKHLPKGKSGNIKRALQILKDIIYKQRISTKKQKDILADKQLRNNVDKQMHQFSKRGGQMNLLHNTIKKTTR